VVAGGAGRLWVGSNSGALVAAGGFVLSSAVFCVLSFVGGFVGVGGVGGRAAGLSKLVVVTVALWWHFALSSVPMAM
jgi:uncharacterized membrane protein YtjA (UPF0391 family)